MSAEASGKPLGLWVKQTDNTYVLHAVSNWESVQVIIRAQQCRKRGQDAKGLESSDCSCWRSRCPGGRDYGGWQSVHRSILHSWARGGRKKSELTSLVWTCWVNESVEQRNLLKEAKLAVWKQLQVLWRFFKTHQDGWMKVEGSELMRVKKGKVFTQRPAESGTVMIFVFVLGS